MKKKFTIPLIYIIIGLAIAGLAIFGDRLGLDPSRGWGNIRIALLLFGLILVFCAMLLWRYMDEVLIAASRIRSFVENHPIAAGIRRDQSIVYLSGLFNKYWFVLPILILVTLVYIWFVSSGTWVTWISPTHYYADLARGFLKGKLYLPIKPNPSLLTSPDPYEASSKLGLQGPMDYSYFQGKFYLYWGPVPALILVLIHPIISWRLGDLQLLFVFLTGLFMLRSLLTIIIWDRFFSKMPKYILCLSILLIGFASPATFMLDNYKSARIYEAAITGGQFFLAAGFLAALTALNPPVSRWGLALAGSLWALAIGTRLLLALPVGFMVLMVAWWILRANHRSFEKITLLIPLGVPLALGFAGLGWYNWARFGSVTESGIFYQLSGTLNVQKHYSELISPIYILQNLYNYLLNPFEVRNAFPYIYAEYGNIKAIFSSYPLPAIYSAQQITGLVYTVPFVIFAIFSLASIFNTFFKRGVDKKSTNGDDGYLLNWITLNLSGCCLAVIVALLTFFGSTMRYLEDVMPSLIMLSIIGFWLGFQALSQKPFMKRLYTFSGIVLAGTSILMSTLVALSMNDARFEIIHFLSFTR